MRNRLWLVLAAGAGLVVFMAASPTGALWRDQQLASPGDLSTGTLRLTAGGQEKSYPFDALSASDLVPGQSVRAPLVIANTGSTGMLYSMTGVTATAATTADQELAGSLLLTVTDDASCGPTAADGTAVLYQGQLGTGATFTGRRLAPSGSEALCVTVTLDSNTPAAAAAGRTQVIFGFRGDQNQ
jgi:hypothetical protein